MLRGYRCIVVTALGCLALAATNPKHAAANPQANSEKQRSAALDRIPATLEDQAKPSEHDKPCHEDSENRASDLCAQWKAADAAKLAADVAWWVGVVGSFIGSLTLGAAVYAAFYAKRAATETKRGADAAERAVTETQRIGEAQVRCYLSVTGCWAAYYEKGVSICCEIQNSGQSPAFNVRWHAEFTHMIDHNSRVRSGKTNQQYGLFEYIIPANGSRKVLMVETGFTFDNAEIAEFHVPRRVAAQARILVAGKDVFGNDVTAESTFLHIHFSLPSLATEIEMAGGTMLAKE